MKPSILLILTVFFVSCNNPENNAANPKFTNIPRHGLLSDSILNLSIKGDAGGTSVSIPDDLDAGFPLSAKGKIIN